MRTRRVHKLSGASWSNTRQTLGQRIRWLRAHQKPPMTQQQLADISGISLQEVSLLELDKIPNINTITLRKLAHAMDCLVYVNIKWKPSKAAGECQLLALDLPPPPKRCGRPSERVLHEAAEVLRYPWKTLHRQRYASRRKGTSGTRRSKDASEE